MEIQVSEERRVFCSDAQGTGARDSGRSVARRRSLCMLRGELHLGLGHSSEAGRAPPPPPNGPWQHACGMVIAAASAIYLLPPQHHGTVQVQYACAASSPDSALAEAAYPLKDRSAPQPVTQLLLIDCLVIRATARSIPRGVALACESTAHNHPLASSEIAIPLHIAPTAASPS